ncbi:YXWGXW repeat-containing protein [Planctomyces sp. SH-PL62]|uniref:YXWGXW repeat-containing protein n=1 Tax=Planctomyces sp. SH-PL62 TaxID=1636152 RepID=UPI00078E4332|nr:YXWGXW repeat-containing protein [Planctomyces sp. SH-PL62]AMV37226.1 hypothetical protein VT85_07325 [Planctomyces sp. SH-PL62]
MDRTSTSCNRQRIGPGARTLAAVWLVGLSAIYATARGQGPSGDSPDGVEVLTRGPVHEAFAVPVVNDPKPGLIISRTPPEAVEEMPPDQKPAGDDVQWMPGYWSWDQGRDDFVWVSGIWREPPPGRQWVPGYWNPVPNGSQWVPGAWIPVGQAAAPLDAEVGLAQGEAAYLPEPPASLEAGPNIPRPSTEVFWSPGCWFWRQARYVWRPGFWAAVQPTWVWVPAHYVWTPGGCLFVEGYWDLPLVDRGILFAPVYYARPVYLQPAYVYTPTITIAAPGLVANLFVQPTYNHYCFGDYYDSRFLSVGVFPWFSFSYQSGPRPPAYYDPLFTFYASVNVRSNPGWASRCRDDYVLRRDNIAMRPPRTYIEQTRIVQNNVNITNNVTIINQGRGGRPGTGAGHGPAAMIGRPIEQVAMRRPEPGAARLERLDVDARRQWQSRSRQMADFRVERAGRELEATPRPGPGAARPAQAQQQLAQARPRPFAMSASPVAAPRLDRAPAARPARPSRPQDQAVSLTEGPARPVAPRPLADRPNAVVARPERREPPVGRVPGPMAPRERPMPAAQPLQARNPAAPFPRPQPGPGGAAPAAPHRGIRNDPSRPRTRTVPPRWPAGRSRRNSPASSAPPPRGRGPRVGRKDRGPVRPGTGLCGGRCNKAQKLALLSKGNSILNAPWPGDLRRHLARTAPPPAPRRVARPRISPARIPDSIGPFGRAGSQSRRGCIGYDLDGSRGHSGVHHDRRQG